MKEIIYFKCETYGKLSEKCETYGKLSEKCETYGKLSENREEILQCEASHYGLTVAEKQEWDSLKEECRYACATVIRTNNEETRKEFDSAIEKCINFEREHNIENRVTILTAVAKIKI